MRILASTLALSALSLSLSITATQAQTVNSGWTVGAHIGSTGLGIHGAKAISPLLSASGTLDVFSISAEASGTVGGTNVTLENSSTIVNGSAVGNIHPFRNGFKMSAGLLFGDFAIDGSQSETFTYDNGGTATDVDGTISYDVGLQNKAMPYLGLGWGGRRQTSGFSFYGDAGAGWSGGSKASGTLNWDCANDNDCETAETAAQDDLNDTLADFPDLNLYPVVRLGVSYNF